MSLQLIAKQMEAKGRGGDSVLVHMTPGEVAGLQQLAESAGGSLSVNPETGLVEASFLKRVLPAVAGIAASAYFGPLGGTIASSLAGGLMGGAGGDQPSQAQGTIGRIRAGEDIRMRSPYDMPENSRDALYEQSRPVMAAQGGLMRLAEGGMTGASADAFNYLMGNAETSPVMQGAIEAQRVSNAGAPAVDPSKRFLFDPATGAFTRNAAYVDPMAKPAVEPVLFIGGGGGGEGGYQGDGMGGGYGGYASDDSPDGAYGLSPGGPRGGGPTMSDQMTADTYGTDYGSQQTSMLSDQEAGFFAKGGIASLAKGGMASGGFVFPADALSALGNGSTDAGLRKLNAMMGGGVTLIEGKGDGLSDSIPTNIDGKQPARVADGEAYIEPAKVKEKGGAKVLYAMMDKVRAQAHGKTSQQRKVNPAKVL